MAPVYAQLGDVQARIPYRPLDGSSEPTAAQVTKWLETADGLINGVLAANGITTPVPATLADGRQWLNSLATDYAEGHVRMAFAAAGGDSANRDGRELLESFQAILDWMLEHPAQTQGRLEAGDVDAGVRAVRGPPASGNAANQSTSDLEPAFSRDEKW